MLLADLKGGLKSFPEHGGLYDNKNAEVPVPKESVEFKKENEYKKNEFQRDLEKGMELSVIQRKNYNLDEDVNVWSDYLYSRFHPRTVNVIKEYEHDSQVPFEVYPQGTTLWGTEQFDDEFCDKIRQYLEECNNFQVPYLVVIEKVIIANMSLEKFLVIFANSYKLSYFYIITKLFQVAEKTTFRKKGRLHLDLLYDSWCSLYLMQCCIRLSYVLKGTYSQ